MYFDNCFTPSELKEQYRYWCKSLHPDKGGDKAQFQEMQKQYKIKKTEVNNNEFVNTMPNIFSRKESYEYYYRPVVYVGILFNHYYKFIQKFGAEILIDANHIRLIFTKTTKYL